jgi:hypothetical protein
MQLPFSAEQFFEVIRTYNNVVWPAQVALTALAIVAVGLLWSHQAWATRAIWLVLALLWAWIATAYHLVFFTGINPAAYAFGLLFYVGSAVFLWSAIRPGNLTLSPRPDARTAVGLGLIVYALVVYPIWSSLTGHAYPSLPTFGLPCPTTIFTIGMLAMVRGGRMWPLFVAPIIWALIGVQAAFLLSVLPDLGLGLAALAGIALVLLSRRALPQAADA